MSGSSETFDPSMGEILSSIRRIISDEKKSSSSLSEDASKGESILEFNDPLREEVSGPGSAGRQGNCHGDPRSR